MKKYEILFGNWNSGCMEVPAMDIMQAISVALQKMPSLNVSSINKITCLGTW